MIQALVAWGPAAIWAAVLFLLSGMQPGSGGVWGLVNDKVAHLGLYAILGAALAWGGSRSRKTPPLLILTLVGVGYGALDEWHQGFVPGRDPSGADLLADAGGVFLGLWALRLLLARAGRTEPSSERDSTPRNP